MIKDQIPTGKKKSFEKFKYLDVIQTSNGNLFIKIDPNYAIPLGCYEAIGIPLREHEFKTVSVPYVHFDLGKEHYVKVGRIKFKKEFLKYMKQDETA